MEAEIAILVDRNHGEGQLAWWRLIVSIDALTYKNIRGRKQKFT